MSETFKFTGKVVICRTFFEMFTAVAKHVEQTGEKIWSADNPLRGMCTNSHDGVHWLVTFMAWEPRKKFLPKCGWSKLSEPLRKSLKSPEGRVFLANSMADPKFRAQFLD